MNSRCKLAVAQVMNDMDRVKLEELKKHIEERDRGLHADPSSLDELKAVLNVISCVRKESMNMEIEYLDLEERYRTRELYNVPNDEDELKEARAVRYAWSELLEETERVDESLEEVKVKFTAITRTQVLEFTRSNMALAEDIRTNGPGLPDVDLDKGVELMKKFQDIMVRRSSARPTFGCEQVAVARDPTVAQIAIWLWEWIASQGGNSGRPRAGFAAQDLF